MVGGPTRYCRFAASAAAFGESSMKRFCTTSIAVALTMVCLANAEAAPPTVTPSPGYDARLQEQRAAAAAPAPIDTVVQPMHSRHRVKRAHNAR
jgi:hypothetical protein